MTDRYAVVGNPVDHSRSPLIHAAFAHQTGEDLEYGRLLAPLDGFAPTVEAFRGAGGRGVNVTVPFKEQAYKLADVRSDRAEAAGAANTLRFDPGVIFGDNTDGIGLVRDLRDHLACDIRLRRVLLLGAGGAARGVLGPLLAERPASVTVANRNVARALELAERFGPVVRGCGYDALPGQRFDLVINATSASLAGQLPPLPPGLWAPGALAYDMMYGQDPTPFMQRAAQDGAERIFDGLGMLVEQAAESYFIWRGVRPETADIRAILRAS